MNNAPGIGGGTNGAPGATVLYCAAQSTRDCCHICLKLSEHFAQLIKGRFTYDFREYFVLEIHLIEVDISRRTHLGKDLLEILRDCS